ncbi:MAG: DUF2130 domain-containing protein, partial [Leuconostoc pseudomesenteroides]
MAKVKFHIASQTELVLDEDAKAGDIVDLNDEQNIDTTVINGTIAEMLDDKLSQSKTEWEAQQQAQAKAELENQLQQQKATLQENINDKENKIVALETQLKSITQQNNVELKAQLTQKDLDLKDTLADKQAKITALESQIETIKQQHQAELETQLLKKDATAQSELSQRDQKVSELTSQLQLKDKEKELQIANVKDQYEAQLKSANEQVEFYKDFKARQSTKEIGESLEQYAMTEFNKIRPYAFPNAYFEKDNELSETNSKGDFIFRDYQDGTEFVSIMFDMKNEADTTASKHKNTDFFKELDKDRREKNTEYAVLVSMLEADSDLYNTGIVQVNDYDKMYVIRPQFFIQFIGVLRNAALNSVAYKQELEQVREQNIDITHFESDLTNFKNAFGKNYQSASKNFKSAIDEIDKAIARMEAVKRSLTTSENQLRLANNKLEDVSVKKLTRGNPTMKAKFD